VSEDFVVHVVVGGMDYNGPTLWPVKVVCNQNQLEDGLHYDAAKNWVANNVLNADGLLWCCDDKDPAKCDVDNANHGGDVQAELLFFCCRLFRCARFASARGILFFRGLA
jgi:hypothetical protein